MQTDSYVSSGLYTIADAARLISVKPARLRRWITGDPHDYKSTPLIGSQIPRMDGQVSISFVNLIEALFISKFAARGLHVRSIRAMADEAKRFLGTPHPFATKILFRADGKKIFAEIVKRSGDEHALYDLQKHNWAFHGVLKHGLRPTVVYGPSDQAERWYPRKKLAPNVIVNPAASFGQPVLADVGIPTRTLRDAVKAEGGDCITVSKWFDIPIARVEEAIKFESRLDRAA
jgi:uncharacterized protein (DUF433 family)